MRKEFVGHFKRPEREVKAIWKTATFVFDANVLLNLYRYSSETRNAFLSLFNKVEQQMWLPEQVAYEFLKNRPEVISEQSKAYETAITDVDKLSGSFSAKRAHPFISSKVKKAYDHAAQAIKEEMRQKKDAQDKLLTEDSIRDQIADLFEGKIGPAYAAQEMSDVYKEGVKRYAESTPPGYEDRNKFKDPKNNTEKRSNFGDWIVWRQLIDFTKGNEKPVILVTNDTKEDWWLKRAGRTLGPRPELIAEFFEETAQHILIYQPERFLTLGNQNLHAEIDSKFIDEVSSEREAREKSRAERAEILRSENKLVNRRVYKNNLIRRENERLEGIQRHPISDKEREWRLESLREQLHEDEEYMEHIKLRVASLQSVFSVAIEEGDQNRASEIDGLLHEAMLEEKDLAQRLGALRNAYGRELKS